MNDHSKIEWNKWNPGLDNDSLTLREVKETLPGANPDDIGLLVRLLENPKSPLALTGAVSLERHDVIHILLGRGLLGQDEAFVIGFTMGTAREDLGQIETFIFKNVARYLYPTNYRLSKKNMVSYELGLEAGKNCKVPKIYEYKLEDCYEKKLGDIRRDLGIDIAYLKSVYSKEQKLLPETKASKRLPV